MGRSYRDLIAWQRAMDLAESVYMASRAWPKEEQYGLTGQVRRAVSSIPANIAEGQGRASEREFLRFLSIATGSLYETETHLQLARRIGYLPHEALDTLLSQTAAIGRLLNGLSSNLRARIAPPSTDY